MKKFCNSEGPHGQGSAVAAQSLMHPVPERMDTHLAARSSSAWLSKSKRWEWLHHLPIDPLAPIRDFGLV